jgi:hypothetical protein
MSLFQNQSYRPPFPKTKTILGGQVVRQHMIAGLFVVYDMYTDEHWVMGARTSHLHPTRLTGLTPGNESCLG